MKATNSIIFHCLSVLLSTAVLAQPSESGALPDPEAVEAFVNFWDAFEDYERATLQKTKREYELAWEQDKSKLDQELKDNQRQQEQYLKDAAQKYKDHLRQFQNASNRPYVMLNLAQILDLIAGNYPVGSDLANQYRQQSLAVLKDVTEQFPGFDKRAETLYLRASVLESLSYQKEALAIWRVLSRTNQKSEFTAYANLALGDYHFDREEPQQAIPYYKAALSSIDSIGSEGRDYERLRIEYRLAWAAYRASDLSLAISSALPLLHSGREVPSAEQRRKIQQDAVDLIGDTLYEQDRFPSIEKTLRNKQLDQFAPAIGSKILRRYHANNLQQQTAQLGSFLIDEFPLAEDLPNWLNLTAGVMHSLKLPEEVTMLERLAYLLPENSLWRSRHKDDFRATKSMEDLALPGAKAAAAHHYDHGLASGNKNSFLQAAAFYSILIDFEPQSEEANQWRARKAHCNYFGGNLEKADKLYSELKEDFQLSPETLETSSYQQVMTRRKKWMEAFSAAAESGSDPKAKPEVNVELRAFMESVNQFADRFPQRNRSVDLLLMAGSANSDHGYVDTASQYWERALISQPNTQQRADAIRGLISAAVKHGDSEKLIALSRRFLKLENWDAKGLSLAGELKGVLSTAALDESDRLNDKGELIAAGALLVQLAQEFKDLPKREKIYRDGAYMLAIAGDWPSAEQAAKAYLKEKLKSNAGDMHYLEARSAEFQVRFAEAARQYVELGRSFPQHSRSLTSLQRGENLALAEDDYLLAGQAAELIGDRKLKSDVRLSAYESAYRHFERQEAFGDAERVAGKRLAISKRLDDRLQSQLLQAKAQYALGDESTALTAVARIAADASKSRRSLRNDIYRDVAGEAQLILGKEALGFFSTFDIFERSGGLSKNLRTKTKYFEQLSKHFDDAAASDHPEYAAEARFLLGHAAQVFADEMRSISQRVKVSSSAKESYTQTAARLEDLAKKYHGNNLLARNRQPKLFKGNQWVQKSAIKLTGYGANADTLEAEEVLPQATEIQLPQQWSL